MPEEKECVGDFDSSIGESPDFEEDGASAWDSDDFDASIPDSRSSCGEGVRADSSAKRFNVLRSSSVSAKTAMRVPTFTPLDPVCCCRPAIVNM